MCSNMQDMMLDLHQKLIAMVKPSLSAWWNLQQKNINEINESTSYSIVMQHPSFSVQTNQPDTFFPNSAEE